MVEITRRDLVASGLLLSSPLVTGGMAFGASLPLQPTAIMPRELLLFDFDWRFALGHGSNPEKDFGFGWGQSDFSKTGDFKFAKAGFDDSAWRRINLPHDWAVELPFVHDDSGEGDKSLRSHGYKPIGRRYPESSVGWYRRVFDIPATDQGRRIWIEFDGAFRDVLVFVNGCFIGRNNNGYAPFRFDITDFLVYGGQNIIALRVDASFGDGWFYEGAGLYRHVWLLKTDAVHLERWESTVRTTLEGKTAHLALAARAENNSKQPSQVKALWKIRDAKGAIAAVAESDIQHLPPGASCTFSAEASLKEVALWSPEAPNLYTAELVLEAAGKSCDGEIVTFGVRTAVFDPHKGFFLNGAPLKLKGTCNHQDHAGVGAALPDALQQYRLSVLQGMGCNAVRTSHNMPTPEWVQACDRSGVMMMCETRLMSSNPEGMAQLETMLKRFRNSPSIIIWSIGNEEFLLQDKMAEQGAKIAATMVAACHALDPTRPVTAAVNASNEGGVSEPVDVIGFNYNEWFPDGFHQKHPNRPVVGTETSSAVSTRGEYKTDPKRNTMSSYDGVVSWGKTPEDWWKFYASREWTAGGFAWTGFDYRGEPTPYGWPSISSQFGIVDMCGFPKDYYYYYKAWWRAEPSLHLFPHWTWDGRDGEEIPVWVYSNLDEVELWVNGRSLGRKPVPNLGHLQWNIAYQPGYIEARGYSKGRMVHVARHVTAGPAVALRMSADRNILNADAEDAALIKVEAVDAKGNAVPTANHKLAFNVVGAGSLIGVGNGDPNCLESDKEPRRSLFNGLAQLIVQASHRSGTILVEARQDGGATALLKPARLALRAKSVRRRPFVA